MAAIALFDAAILVVAGLLKLGFLANLMSKAVLTGFLTGVGIQIAVGQLPDILGIEASGGFFEKLWDTITGLPQADPLAVAIAAGVFLVVLLTERISSRLPAMLFGLIAAMATVSIFGWGTDDLELVGEIPAGLPPIALPDFAGLSAAQLGGLFGTAMAVAFVVLAQSAATSRSFAAKGGYDVDVSQDLVGIGAANLAAGVTGAFPVNGSVSRTAAMDGAGGRTQMASIVSFLVIVVVLLFATGLLATVPMAALGAIIFLAVTRLVKVRELAQIWRTGRGWAFWVAITTAIGVCVLGVERGVILAVIVSLLEGLSKAYRPPDAILARDGEGDWTMQPLAQAAQSAPGYIVYSVQESMRFYNIEYSRDRLLVQIREAPDPVHTLMLAMYATTDVDYSAGLVLRELVTDLQSRGIRVLFVAVNQSLRQDLDRYGITDLVGADAYFKSPRSALRTLGVLPPKRG